MTMARSQIVEEREFPFSEGEFRLLADMANRETGIVLASHKKDMVYSRLVRRLRALGLKSFADYIALVQTEAGEGEIGNMVNAITTNLTSFFRESHHFTHLHDEVLLPLNHVKEKRLRIWSAGCSAGMEAYSIAMTMKKALKDLNAWDARILATDIDTNMLKAGIMGEYDAAQLQNISREYHAYIESSSSSRITMRDELRQLTSFKELNLLGQWPMKGLFDAVFCRNVVIYFDKPTQSRLFNRIAEQLKPNGWLYIGHSENLFKVCDRFELVGRTIYRKVR